MSWRAAARPTGRGEGTPHSHFDAVRTRNVRVLRALSVRPARWNAVAPHSHVSAVGARVRASGPAATRFGASRRVGGERPPRVPHLADAGGGCPADIQR